MHFIAFCKVDISTTKRRVSAVSAIMRRLVEWIVWERRTLAVETVETVWFVVECLGNRNALVVTSSASGPGNASVFITPTAANERPPSVLGGGYSLDPVETPFDFDKGGLVHYDTHATFYSLTTSKEYDALVEEYESAKAACAPDELFDLAMRYYTKHRYLLEASYDVVIQPSHSLSYVNSC